MISEIKDIMMTILEEKEKNMNDMENMEGYEDKYLYCHGENIAYTKVYKLLRKVVYGDE